MIMTESFHSGRFRDALHEVELDQRGKARLLAAIDAALNGWRFPDFPETPAYREAARDWCLRRVVSRHLAGRIPIAPTFLTDEDMREYAARTTQEIEKFPTWERQGGFRVTPETDLEIEV